jgi:hypothetical protein
MGAGQIGKVLSLPLFRWRFIGAWHLIYSVVEPSVPFGRDAARFLETIIDNPTPPTTSRWNAPLVIVFVAFRIHADLLAAQPSQNMRNCRRHRETPFFTDL